MKIYGVSRLDVLLRLKCECEEWDANYMEKDPYIVVVHFLDEKNSINDILPEWMDDFSCKGVLYFKGVSYAGISKEKADSFNKKYQNKVHFLTYRIPTSGISGYLEKKFAEFFKIVKRENRVDWSIIDQPIPENLLAAYLLLTALKQLGNSAAVERIIEQKEVWEPIFCEALEEIQLLGDYFLEYNEINEFLLEEQKRSNLLDVIRKQLEKRVNY